MSERRKAINNFLVCEKLVEQNTVGGFEIAPQTKSSEQTLELRVLHATKDMGNIEDGDMIKVMQSRVHVGQLDGKEVYLVRYQDVVMIL